MTEAPASSRPRVEFLANSLVVGGAEKVVEALCRHLPQTGWEVGLGTLREAGPVGEGLRAVGVEVRTHLAPQRQNPWQLWKLRSHLRRVEADVVYVLDHTNALFYGRLAAASLGRPQLCAIHRTGRADGSASLSRADRMLMPLSRRVVAVSETHARYLVDREGLDGRKVVAIPNGVDLSAFGPVPQGEERRARRRALELPEDAPLAVVVAALRPEKNHELLLRALASRESLAGLHVVVVGDGPRRPILEATARACHVDDRVHWMGRRSDVPEVLAVQDLLVLPSHPRVETFPLCVLEAMAARLPVVATDVGSLREMFGPEGAGALVPAGDHEALADTLEEILAHPEATRARCELAYRRVRDCYDLERMVSSTAELLNEIVNPSRREGRKR